MDDYGSVLFIFLFVGSLAYLFYFRPKIEEANKVRIFDHSVLAVIDGLFLAGMHFSCTDFEMRSYVSNLLQKAHQLPGNQMLLSHTCTTNRLGTFNSHIGLHGEHIIFALLCIIQYGKDYNKPDLIAHCEEMLIEARIMEAHYR